MGIRDRLETIKSSNENSYDEFDFRPFPPEKAAPPPIGNPWLSIWVRPRSTIRAIVANDPGYRFTLLVVLIGLSKALIRCSSRNLGDHVAFPILLLLCALLGPLLTLISFTLGAAILAPIGRKLGGQARSAEVRAALAWGSVPYCAVLLLWVPILFLIGPELFTSIKPVTWSNPVARLAVGLTYLDDLIMLIWGVVLTLAALVEVFRMSIWRVIVSLLLMVPAFVAVLIGPTMMILVAIRVVTTPAPPPPFTIPATSPQPFPFRTTTAPPPNLGPVVRTIWDEGYGVSAGTAFNAVGNKIIRLHLTMDGRKIVDDAALRHLAELPELQYLTINSASGVTDSGLEWIGDLKKLRHLEIVGAAITDDGLANLSGLTELRDLKVVDCDRIKGTGLAHLKACRKLQTLSLAGSQVRASALSQLPYLNRLTVLSIADTGTTDDDLDALKALPRLRDLDLSENPLTDAAIDRLRSIRSLGTVKLGGTLISPAELAALRKARPDLTVLPAEPTPVPVDDEP